jgi:hypothetical protein
MTYGHIQSTAVEIPSARLLPLVAGSIAALAVVGFILGLRAADDGGGATVGGSDLANAAALAGAPMASPIVLNTVSEPPPPPVEPEETEEVETAEAPAAPEVPPPAPLAVPAPVEAAPPAPAAPSPAAAAAALY